MYINCLREKHTDNNASAMINNGSGRYLKDSVRCMGCGTWYMENTPEDSYNTYKELLASLGKDVHLSSIEKGDILPYPKIKRTESYYNLKPKKSRDNFNGMTIKSNLKSDRKIEINGKDIYIDKTPTVSSDNIGTHESVKEFFFNEDINDNGLMDTNRGFYNRISIDSDDEGEILPRLKKAIEYSSLKGFWFILNNGNNRFQININFMHTVINGHDISKVKDVGRCLNNLIGDDHMTNSFMKNHKVYSKDDEGFNMGAQKTRTFGFDIDLQKDYESYISGDSDNWSKKWDPMISDGSLEISFINSISGIEERPSKESICVIKAPDNMDFNIRKDKTWSVSIENLWVNTAVKYAQKKTENDKILYTDTEHGKISQHNMLTFNLMSSILKDNKSTLYNNEIISKNIKTSVGKYLEYYKNSMIAYNPFEHQYFEDSRSINKLAAIKALVKDRKALRDFIIVVRAAMQNGYISINKEGGMSKNWYKIVNNPLNSSIKDELAQARVEEIEIIRNLIPSLTKLSTSNIDKIYHGKRIDEMPIEIRPYMSMAVEATYYNKTSIIMGISERTSDALTEISKSDFSVFRNLSISILLVTMIDETNLFSNNLIYLKQNLKISIEMFQAIMKKAGLNNKVSVLDDLDLLRDSLVELHYASSMIVGNNYKVVHAAYVEHNRYINNNDNLYIFVLENKVNSKRREKVP